MYVFTDYFKTTYGKTNKRITRREYILFYGVASIMLARSFFFFSFLVDRIFSCMKERKKEEEEECA